MSDWLTYSPISGHGNGIITITADTLSTLEDRVATIIVSNSQYSLSASTSVTQKGVQLTAITFENLTWVTDIPSSGGTATKDNCSYAIYANYSNGTSADITTSSTVSGNLQVSPNYAIERHSAGTLTLSAEYINEYGQTFTCTGDVIAYQSILQSEIDSIDLYGLMWLTDIPWSGGTANSANCAFDVDLVLKYGNRIDIENYATISGSLTLGTTSEELRTTAGTLTLTAQYSGFTDSENIDVWQQGLLCGVTVENIAYYGNIIPVSGGTINDNDFSCEVIAHYWDGTTLDVTQYASISYDSIIPEDDDETACITQYNNIIITITATYKGFEGTGDLNISQEVSPYRRYLKIIAKESGVLYFTPFDSWTNISLDSGNTWTNTSNSFNISSGQEVYFRGKETNRRIFDTNFIFEAEGNAFSLLLYDRPNKKDLSEIIGGGTCINVFNNCTGLTDASRVVFTKLERVSADSNSFLDLSGFFFGCTNMVAAPKELYFKNIESGDGVNCYYMFTNCTSLTTAPDLYFNDIISTNISNERGCEGMFSGCTSLTTVPVFEADYIHNSGCTNMFINCTALTDVHALHFNKVGNYACESMFRNCSSLTTTPTITVSEVSNESFHNMFRNCSSLIYTKVPNIYRVKETFQTMFAKCKNLRYIEYLALPKNIDDYIGTEWVYGVSPTGVFIKHPNANSWVIGANGIPSGWAVENYSGDITGISFDNLTWVTDIPALGGTGDSANCSYTIIGHYDNGISKDITSSATVSGSLNVSASTVETRHSAGTLTLTAQYFDVSTTGSVTAYQEGAGVTGISFENLTWVTDIPSSGGTGDSTNCSYSIYANYGDGTSVDVTSSATVSGSLTVPSTTAGERQNVGTLTLTAQYSGFTTTGNIIAYQEAYAPTPSSSTPLTFKIISGGTIVWKSVAGYMAKTISYSKDNGDTWTSITAYKDGTNISVNTGDVIIFKGDNSRYASGTEYYNTFKTTDGTLFSVQGNIMSLIDSAGFATAETLTDSYTFYRLFYNCSGLVSAEHLILPATTLASNCYQEMFQGCTSLATAPKLPATTLTDSCYNHMFQDCSALTQAPELPATTLASKCYGGMFYGCTSLTTAPALPATTLANYCYSYMFYWCKSLATAPELPATTLANYCYNGMFSDCSVLTQAPVLPATDLAEGCYNDMFSDCTSLTIAPALPATTLKAYCYDGMLEGCTSLTTAPELPATTLVNYCYSHMFYNCTSLNYIKCLATDISAKSCTDYWVSGVASTGTFVKAADMSRWTTGSDGIPSGWTVTNAS